MEMKIAMGGYNLESFQEKEVYTWEEIISKIEDLESQIFILREKLEKVELSKYEEREEDEE